MRVALVVNPVAGMGGRVGLKGTDQVAAEAEARGAEPVAPGRADRFLARVEELLGSGALAEAPRWLTASGPMGEDALRAREAGPWEVVHRAGARTGAPDTRAAAREALARGAEVVVFVGGDGTARDLALEVGGRVPLLGVPSGVKMHSAVFALTPEGTADILAEHAQGLTRVVEAEVLDVDEEAYRRGEWKVRLYAMARTLDEPVLRQAGKLVFEEVGEEEQLEDLAAHVLDLAAQHPGTLFLLGPGSTLERVGTRLGVRKTLLGFDAWRAGRQEGADLDERGILRLLDAHPDACLVVSPIGAQGFFLGRGNQQASAEVVRRLGPARIVVLATPGKVRATPVLHVDTGDPALDAELRARGHWPVVVGYRTSRMVPLA